MVLTEKQRVKKAEQDSIRYYKNKELKIKMKALNKETKIQKEQDRKDAIKRDRIYRFKHMDLKRPKYGPQVKPNDSDILMNDFIISSESETDDEIEPVPIIATQMKYNFV